MKLPIHTPSEDGGWWQWFLIEIKAAPSALIEFFAIAGIILVAFGGI